MMIIFINYKKKKEMKCIEAYRGTQGFKPMLLDKVGEKSPPPAP